MTDQATNLQPELAFSEEDCALLLPQQESRKRYTADQVQQLEYKRNAIVLLLGFGCPVEVIARQLHVNLRTVAALAARNAEEVAGSMKMLGETSLALGARWLGLAKMREHDASFLQLATGAGIAIDKGLALSAMGQMSDGDGAKEVTDHAQAAEALRRLMEGDQAAGGSARPDEAQSGGSAANPQENGQFPQVAAPADALPATRTDQASTATVRDGNGTPRRRPGGRGSRLGNPHVLIRWVSARGKFKQRGPVGLLARKKNAPRRAEATLWPEPVLDGHWRRIRFERLAWLLEHAPERLRWRWRRNKKTGPKLQVVSPRGAAWDFKLSGGAWIRPAGSGRATC